MSHRRSNIEIIADILRIGQASKTQIMYRVGMRHDQLHKYLDYLMERSFLNCDSIRYPGAVYHVSQDGKLLLQSIENIERLLNSADGAASPENISESLAASRSGGGKGHRLHKPGRAIPQCRRQED